MSLERRFRRQPETLPSTEFVKVEKNLASLGFFTLQQAPPERAREIIHDHDRRRRKATGVEGDNHTLRKVRTPDHRRSGQMDRALQNPHRHSCGKKGR